MSLSGKKSFRPIVLMTIVVLFALFSPSLPGSDANYTYNGADIAWMLASTALVLIMTRIGLFLWRDGQEKKRHFYDVAEFYLYGSDGGIMGRVWFLVGFW